MKKLVTLTVILAGMTLAPVLKAQQGGVAIVDLDAVAKDLGVLEFIAVTLENTKVDLDGKLVQMQNSLQSQMDDEVKKAGDTPSKEQAQQIAVKRNELNLQLNNARVQATQTINMQKLQLIKEFRDELRPHALALAKEKGMSVVLNKVMPPVYAYVDAVDITKELTEKARKEGLARKAPQSAAQPKGKGKGKGK